MKQSKSRRPFILTDSNGTEIAHGIAYHQGNVQVYMRPDYSAWQMQLSDVLHIDGVVGFAWCYPDKRYPIERSV